jgi:hypothetical protein
MTIYLAMAVLLVAMPQPVAYWLADLPPGVLTGAARSAVAVVSNLAELTGLPQFYEATRHGFLRAIGRGPRQRPRT